MPTGSHTAANRLSWLNRWWLPFLWIILTPTVTVPLSAILFSVLAGYHSPVELGLPANPPPCPFLFGDPDPNCGPQFRYSEVAPTIFAFALPGLLNLLPFLWVSSTRPRVIAAGIVAGLLGLLRLALPPTVLMLALDRVSSDGGSYFKYALGWFANDSPSIVVWPLGALAWLGSLIVWAVFGWLTRSSDDNALAALHKGERMNEQRRWEEAKAQFDKAIALDPALPFAWEGRALAHAQLGDLGQATMDLEKALSLARGIATRASIEEKLGELKRQRSARGGPGGGGGWGSDSNGLVAGHPERGTMNDSYCSRLTQLYRFKVAIGGLSCNECLWCLAW